MLPPPHSCGPSEAASPLARRPYLMNSTASYSSVRSTGCGHRALRRLALPLAKVARSRRTRRRASGAARGVTRPEAAYSSRTSAARCYTQVRRGENTALLTDIPRSGTSDPHGYPLKKPRASRSSRSPPGSRVHLAVCNLLVQLQILVRHAPEGVGLHGHACRLAHPLSLIGRLH